MSASATDSSSVRKIYQTVVDEVIQNVREQFLDEGYDDQFLQELKHIWETKLNASRALNEQHEQTAKLPIVPAKDDQNAAATAVDPATMAAFNALPQAAKPKYVQQQQQQYQQKPKLNQINSQLDGIDDDDDSSSDDDVVDENPASPVDEFDDDVDIDKQDEGKEDPDPLNSSDDVSEGDPDELFDTDNVIICQYDKITRIKNRWKFYLKDGVMNINGKDYLFSKANGDAEW